MGGWRKGSEDGEMITKRGCHYYGDASIIINGKPEMLLYEYSVQCAVRSNYWLPLQHVISSVFYILHILVLLIPTYACFSFYYLLRSMFYSFYHCMGESMHNNQDEQTLLSYPRLPQAMEAAWRLCLLNMEIGSVQCTDDVRAVSYSCH